MGYSGSLKEARKQIIITPEAIREQRGDALKAYHKEVLKSQDRVNRLKVDTEKQKSKMIDQKKDLLAFEKRISSDISQQYANFRTFKAEELKELKIQRADIVKERQSIQAEVKIFQDKIVAYNKVLKDVQDVRRENEIVLATEEEVKATTIQQLQEVNIQKDEIQQGQISLLNRGKNLDAQKLSIQSQQIELNKKIDHLNKLKSDMDLHKDELYKAMQKYKETEANFHMVKDKKEEFDKSYAENVQKSKDLNVFATTLNDKQSRLYVQEINLEKREKNVNDRLQAVREAESNLINS